MALTDGLTGLPNRTAFITEVERRSCSAQPHERFAIIAFEIAGIDATSQQFGVSTADMVIQAIARRVLEARTPECSWRAPAARSCAGSAQSSTAMMHETAPAGSIPPSPESFSSKGTKSLWIFGLASRRSQTMRKTPICCYNVHRPRLPVLWLTRWTRSQSMTKSSTPRHLSSCPGTDLRGALERGEFELFYQPQVWIADREVIGYEALLRWRHPVFGLVSPADFIPIAERTGGILSIGNWALRMACKEATEWPAGCRVAVNVSPLQLRQADLPDQGQEAPAMSGLAPDQLEIELTESLLIDDQDRALDVLRRIGSLGVRLSLDDFGTGYSSMDVLRRFPFDKVKLDRSFVEDIETDRHARAILHAMVALGRELAIPILVEGVETELQLAILRSEGVKKVQGYLTGRPMPATSIPQHASKHVLA